MDNKKIIILNAIFSFLILSIAIGYFELRTVSILKKIRPTSDINSQNNFLEQNSLNGSKDEASEIQEPASV